MPPPRQTNPGVWIAVGIVVAALIGVGAFLALSSKDEPYSRQPTDVANTNQNPAGTQPDSGGPGVTPAGGPTVPGAGPSVPGTSPGATPSKPEPKPEPSNPPGIVPKPEPGGGEPERPAPGGGDEEPPAKPEPAAPSKPIGEYYGMTTGELRRVPYDELCRPLDHFEDTPADLREEIDKLCALLVDVNAGSAGNRAVDRLKEIGRPAVPRVLSMHLESKTGDWSKQDGWTNVCFVSYAWDEITRHCDGLVSNYMRAMAAPRPKDAKNLIRWRYVWWLSKGYKLTSYASPDEDEEEED